MSEGQLKTPGNYLGSLDGYRALGTFVVVMHHVPFIFIRSPFAYSWWVLQSFFVMSGFLLARILIKEKKKGYPFLQYLKNFYLKRLLRIFPLYWAFLAVLGILLLAFGVTQIPLYSGLMAEYKQNWWLLWTYLYNFKDLASFIQQENGNLSPFLTHLWSLAVEEQFYILLPLMIFFLSEKNLKRVIIGIIVISPILRIITYFYFNHLAYTPAYSSYFENNDYLKESWVTVIMLRSTWTQLDCLAFGMALAVWDFKWIGSAKKWFYWLFLLFVVIVTINGLVYSQHMDLAKEMANPYFAYQKAVELFPEWLAKLYIAVSDHHALLINFQFVYMYTFVNFLSMLIVLSCIRDKPFLWFLKNERVIYTGKITYGMYIFHYPLLMFIILFGGWVFKKVDNKFGQLAFELSLLAVFLPVLWYLSHLSFKYFESYFMRLKDKVK